MSRFVTETVDGIETVKVLDSARCQGTDRKLLIKEVELVWLNNQMESLTQSDMDLKDLHLE